MKESTLVKFRKGFCTETEANRIYIIIECHNDVRRAYIQPLHWNRLHGEIIPTELVTYDMIEEF